MAEVNYEGNAVEYRTIARYPGYRFGSDGSVWSCWRKCSSKTMTGQWRRLNGSVHRGTHGANYVAVAVRAETEKRRRNHLAHRLVLEAFAGPPPEGAECCHGNGISTDNRIGNLRWDTPINNSGDKVRHGTVCRGSKHGFSKLNEQQVLAIRSKHAMGQRPEDLAAEYGVHVRTIRRIITRRIWRHV